MSKFVVGKTDSEGAALEGVLGSDWKATAEHLLSIGFFSKGRKGGEDVFSTPFLCRHGMSLTQGKA